MSCAVKGFVTPKTASPFDLLGYDMPDARDQCYQLPNCPPFMKPDFNHADDRYECVCDDGSTADGCVTEESTPTSSSTSTLSSTTLEHTSATTPSSTAKTKEPETSPTGNPGTGKFAGTYMNSATFRPQTTTSHLFLPTLRNTQSVKNVRVLRQCVLEPAPFPDPVRPPSKNSGGSVSGWAVAGIVIATLAAVAFILYGVHRYRRYNEASWI